MFDNHYEIDQPMDETQKLYQMQFDVIIIIYF